MSEPQFEPHPGICDLCGNTEHRTVVSPRQFPEEMEVHPRVVRCAGCGHLYTVPRITEAFATGLYKKYYATAAAGTGRSRERGSGRLTSLPWLRRLYHAYCGQYLGEVLAKARGKTLDIGCGTGDMLDDLSRRGIQPFGIELNPESVSVCRQKGFNVQCGTLESLPFENELFDTVIMWHVIEHVPSPVDTLRRIRDILVPGGKIFMYCPNADSYMARMFGRYWYGWHVPFHFNHFTVSTMHRLCARARFEIIKNRAVTSESIFPYSVDVCARYRGSRIFASAATKRLCKSLWFRLLVSPLFRAGDMLLRNKGESLQVEAQKPFQRKGNRDECRSRRDRHV